MKRVHLNNSSIYTQWRTPSKNREGGGGDSRRRTRRGERYSLFFFSREVAWWRPSLADMTIIKQRCTFYGHRRLFFERETKHGAPLSVTNVGMEPIQLFASFRSTCLSLDILPWSSIWVLCLSPVIVVLVANYEFQFPSSPVVLCNKISRKATRNVRI